MAIAKGLAVGGLALRAMATGALAIRSAAIGEAKKVTIGRLKIGGLLTGEGQLTPKTLHLGLAAAERRMKLAPMHSRWRRHIT